MANSSTDKHLVVYADDDEDDLFFVQEAFNSCALNIQLVTAEDGLQCIQYLQNLPEGAPLPCLIVLDVNMPRMNGKEALVEIRKMPRFKQVPVVLFTNSSLPQDIVFAKEHGAAFITKPLEGAQMALIAEQFISFCTADVTHCEKRK